MFLFIQEKHFFIKLWFSVGPHQALERVLDSFVIEETAESQGRPEVQDAIKVRKALAEGAFTWSETNLTAMRHNDDELYAKTLRLDDCHSDKDGQSIFKKHV